MDSCGKMGNALWNVWSVNTVVFAHAERQRVSKRAFNVYRLGGGKDAALLLSLSRLKSSPCLITSWSPFSRFPGLLSLLTGVHGSPAFCLSPVYGSQVGKEREKERKREAKGRKTDARERVGRVARCVTLRGQDDTKPKSPNAVAIYPS